MLCASGFLVFILENMSLWVIWDHYSRGTSKTLQLCKAVILHLNSVCIYLLLYSVYFTSKQMQPFDFAGQYYWYYLFIIKIVIFELFVIYYDIM